MFSLTTYFSAAYIAAFLPITIVLYAIVPKKIRRIVILTASYIFFGAISGKLMVYLMLSTLSIHHIGIWLDNTQKSFDEAVIAYDKETKKTMTAKLQTTKRLILLFGIALHIGVLVVLKYTPFFINNINTVLHMLRSDISLAIPKMLIPIGISFYTLQAVSYMVDVYRGKICADKNLLRLLMYMSFFPQIMEGPICRYSDTAASIWNAEPIKYDNFIFGIQRIAYGFMKKLVIADRLNIFIRNVFDNYADYDGSVIMIAAIAYTFQLYMDFSGTMDLVIGSGQIFGVKIAENFKRPFFSKTISEFWKRWHITLGTWFKDYVYFPLSMSRQMKKMTSKARKKLGNYYGPMIAGTISLLCVWICNGLWHGAAWSYIFFGLYHFALITTGNLIEPPVKALTNKLHLNRNHYVYKGMQIIRTFFLVCIGEMFFRANGLKAGISMLKKIVIDFGGSALKDGSFFMFGMDKGDCFIVLLTIAVVFAIGVLQERGIKLRQRIAAQNIVVKYVIWYALILYIVIFGAYGVGYVPVSPMYAVF